MRVATMLLLAVAAAGISALRDEGRARLEWGVYQIFWHRKDYGKQLATVARQVGAPPDYVMFYRDLPRLSFPQTAIDAIRGVGAVPIISLELWSWGDDETRYIPRILAGEYDDALSAWARAARDDGQRILLRFGFEMNGDWFSWGGDPDGFVQAWQHAHALFEAEDASNVEWVWAPNVASSPDEPDNSMHRYYPGDDVVDWLGLDGYNFGDEHDDWHRFESFADIFAAPLEALASRHPGKPVMIAETACAPGEPGDKARWIREAHAWLQDRDEVAALIWFNYDKRRQGEHDWRLDSEPDALAAFRETFAGARPVDR